MFGRGTTFVSLGAQVRLAQAPPPGPLPAPASAPAPAAVAPAPVPTTAPVVLPEPVVTTGLSHGAQVAIAATIAGLAILGAIFAFSND